MLRAALIFLLIAAPAAAQLMYRPSREHRTINTDAYALIVQKNGRVDLRLPNGEAIFDDAYPAVWFEGEDKPDYLPIEGRQTVREPARDVLGQGQGMFFKKGTGEWVIRTYTTQPFVTVQCAFVNDSKRPVRVSRLMPWVIGEPATGMLSLGPGTRESIARSLDAFSLRPEQTPALQHGFGHSGWSLALFNPQTGRSIMAGFLSDARGASYIEVGHDNSDGVDAFSRMRAVTVFDPPVEVPPGGRIESEVLYIALTETDPVSGLARFGSAFARANGAVRGEVESWARWETAEAFEAQYGDRVGRGVVPVVGRTHPLVAPPLPIAAAWNAPEGALGLREAVAWLGANFQYTPYLARPVLMATPMPGASGGGLTPESRLAWYTLCAITGAPVIAIGDDGTDPEWQARLDRLAPALERPARPADAFEHAAPRVWSAPLPAAEGDAHLAGLFNWDPGASAQFALNLPALGLAAGGPYAVFDFWEGRYHGTAVNNLNVEVAPGACRLMLFRARLPRPMLLADSAHFANGAAGAAVEWDAGSGELSGSVLPGARTIHLLVPAPFQAVETTVNGETATPRVDGELLTLAITGGPHHAIWRVRFTRVE